MKQRVNPKTPGIAKPIRVKIVPTAIRITGFVIRF
jgi:hypothetical protein